MSIIVELKKVLLDVNVSLSELAQSLGKRLSKPYSMQNLSNKLRNETITYFSLFKTDSLHACNIYEQTHL